MAHIKYIVLVVSVILSDLTFGQSQPRNTESIGIAPTVDGSDTIVQTSEQVLLAIPSESDALMLQQFDYAYPPTRRDWKKLGINTTVYIYAGALTFGLLWVSPESISNWDKEEIKESGLSWKWKQNIQEGPVTDEDDLYLNYVAHPYVGAIYYTTARSCGFKWYESFGYSFLMSTFFWEYGIEAFAEVPSTQDLIITPTLGSVFGEVFFVAKKNIMQNNKRVLNSKFLGTTTLFLVDPINTIVDGLGYRQKVKTTLTFMPINDYNSAKPLMGFQLTAKF
jgi:hypothetical protein